MKTKKNLKLQGESNAALKEVLKNKLELQFPREEGFLRVGRSNFKHEDDLLSYLAQAFPVEKDSFGHRFSVKRKGKYNRVDKSNRIVFTFVDPVLDLITDERGYVTIGGQRYDLRAAELGNPGRVCSVAKRDSDSDTNDDYVDEYEWGTINTSAPTGVESFCQATWRQKLYSGVVSQGSCDAWV